MSIKSKTLVPILITLLFFQFSCKKYNCHCEVIFAPSITTPPGINSGGETTFTVKGIKAKAKKQAIGCADLFEIHLAINERCSILNTTD